MIPLKIILHSFKLYVDDLASLLPSILPRQQLTNLTVTSFKSYLYVQYQLSFFNTCKWKINLCTVYLQVRGEWFSVRAQGGNNANHINKIITVHAYLAGRVWVLGIISEPIKEDLHFNTAIISLLHDDYDDTDTTLASRSGVKLTWKEQDCVQKFRHLEETLHSVRYNPSSRSWVWPRGLRPVGRTCHRCGNVTCDMWANHRASLSGLKDFPRGSPESSSSSKSPTKDTTTLVSMTFYI